MKKAKEAKPRKIVTAGDRVRRAGKLVSKARVLSLTKGVDARAALPLLIDAARLGSAEAQYALGTWYIFGKGVPKDFAKAADYLAKGASQGHAPAAFDLAILYERGRGVPQDKRRAFALYLQAARREDLDAIRAVGRCVYHGIGTTRSREIANLILDYGDLVGRKADASKKRSSKVAVSTQPKPKSGIA
jgi:uncharacterized protein